MSWKIAEGAKITLEVEASRVWPDDEKVTFFISGHYAAITIPTDAREIIHVQNPPPVSNHKRDKPRR